MGGFWSNDGQISGSSSWTYLLYGANPTYGGHELPMTASSDQAWQKKTHSFNGLNMFESSSLMFFSIRHTLFSSQTCCWFAERPFSLGQVSHVVRQYSPCCWPLSPLPLLANIIWRIHLCWWTSPPKKTYKSSKWHSPYLPMSYKVLHDPCDPCSTLNRVICNFQAVRRPCLQWWKDLNLRCRSYCQRAQWPG
jgi:hypothetical protein